MPPKLIYDLLIILAAGLFAAVLCRRLHVSVLVGYLAIGTLIGESSFGWVIDRQHEIEYLAELGVFLLLFSIGVEFSLEELLKLGRNLLVGGSVQMLLVSIPVAALMRVSGLPWTSALLIAVASAFSSTVLIFKALSEQGHSGLPHGRRAIGILLFQDVALIPLLLLVPLLTGEGTPTTLIDYFRLAATSVLFVMSTVALRRLLARWVIPLLAGYRSPDLVVLLTLVCLGSVTWAAYEVGLPPAIGAFAAGLIFSGNRWTHQVDALVLPFRESFSAIFFVSLGLLADAGLVWRQPVFLLGGLLGLLAIKALAAAAALRLTGLPWKSAFGMGLGLAHIGEFAFVLVVLGWESGLLTERQYERVVTLAIGSLILTPLLLRTGLRWTQVGAESEDHRTHSQSLAAVEQQAIVVGAGPTGRQIASRLETAGKNVCLLDYSALNLQPFAQQGFRTVSGDATQTEILNLAGLSDASIIVVCVSRDDTAQRIVQAVRAENTECFLLVRCRYQINVEKLRQSGASRVVSEEAQANDAIVNILTQLITPTEH
ncbi:MAG: cation:proton antiporter [Planctomycetota bacterium]